MEKSNLDKFKDVKKDSTVIDRSKKLRIGIVGTGWIAGAHMEQYLKMEDVEIVAGCDIVEGKAEAFFKDYGLENVHCYLSDKEMYEKEELDAVSVTSYLL